MFCEQCGKHNDDGKKYCYSCGSPLIPAKTAKEGTVGSGKARASISSLAGAERNPSFYAKKTASASEELKEWQKKQTENDALPAGSPEEKVDRKKTADVKPAERKPKTRKNTKKSVRKPTVTEEELAAMEQELHRLNKSRSPVIALLAALLVLGGVLAILITRVPKLYGAKQEAAGFETAMLSGKWGSAYSYLYMDGETSAFLSEEMFEKVMSRSGASGFRNLVLEEVEGTAGKKVFSATYETSEGTETDYITMCPSGKKKMLFLKEWKVDPETVTVSDIRIDIPSEASLLLNGMVPETEGTLIADQHAVEYQFEKLFSGIWEAELQAENRAPYYADLEISEDDKNGVLSLAGAELYPDQELMDSILKQFAQDYQAILEASVNREDFSVVEKYFASQAIQEGRAQNMYANACSQAYNPETGSGIVKYELSDVTASFVSTVKSGYAQTGDLVMEIQSLMTYTYLDDGVEKSDTQSSVGLLCYHQEDGQWKIQSFS